MSEFQRLAGYIAKGKLPGEHWNQFFAEYKGRTNRLAGTQFALNIVSILMDEHLWQEKELAGLGEEFLKFAEKCLDQNFNPKTITGFDEYRGKIKNHMECLVSYNDRFMIYQYVMNLLKYRFEEYNYNDYSDEEFTKELMNYIISDKDQTNIRYKTMDVLKCLPIRMTKNRFFEMIKDGYSVYKGGELESMKSFDYMLRSAATLAEPENMDISFPALYEYSEHFKAMDPDKLDSEGYYVESSSLNECIEYLNAHISSYQLLAEGINELYAFVLTSEDVRDAEHFEHVKKIISRAINVGTPIDGFEPDLELETDLVVLEGVQEDEMEELMGADGSMEDILGSTFAMQAGEQISEEFEFTDKLRLLVSSSYFADLDNQTEPEEVTEEKMAELYSAFKADMTDKLGSVSKMMGRALMSSCIGCLPMNFESASDLREYIYNSLSACTSLPEKMALVEQLEELMDSDLDWGE